MTAALALAMRWIIRALAAIGRLFPPDSEHRLVSSVLNIAWIFFFRHVWGLRDDGDQEALATMAIAAAALLSYRRIHWFMLSGSWYADIWFRRKILGILIVRWFEADQPKLNPRKRDQRRAIMDISNTLRQWEKRRR